MDKPRANRARRIARSHPSRGKLQDHPGVKFKSRAQVAIEMNALEMESAP
jgi:hypothetical protein